MLKLGDTINLGGKKNPKNTHRNAILGDFKITARIIQSSGGSLNNLCSDRYISPAALNPLFVHVPHQYGIF